MRLYPAARVEEFLRTGWWSGRTFDDLLAEHVAGRPDRLSLVDPLNRPELIGGQARRLRWREVGAEVDGLARALLRAGVRAGDVVGVQLPNIVELPICYLALARLGAIACSFPVQYGLHELTTMGTLAGLSGFVTTERTGTRGLAEQAVALRAELPALQRVLSFGDQLPPDVVELSAAVADDAEDAAYRTYLAALSVHPNDCVTLCWTSGTEGVPKGVPRAHGDWQAVALGTISTPRLTGEDVLLNPFPMVNAGGMAGMFLPWLMLGATLVQHHPFDLGVFLRQVEQEQVSYTCAPPAVLNSLVAHPEALAAHDISSLRAIGSGSAPLSAWMIQAWERDRGVEVLNMFGSNEGLSLYGCPDTVPDPADRGRLFPRPGAAGFAWRSRAGRDCRSKLVDPETGEVITTAGRPGELRVSGPTIFAGYWGEVPAPFDDEGYYRTGDIFAYTDPDCRLLSYLDRAKDLIVRGGYKISAVEVESLLLAHPKVAEVALIGQPDEMLGERVCAVVTAADPADPPSLEDLCGLLADQQVARFKWPQRVELVAALPRNPVGKVLKRELRQQVIGR